MAQVELPSGILAIHGRLGNMIYRSRKQPDGTYKVFVYEAPKKSKKASKKTFMSRSWTDNGPRMDRDKCEKGGKDGEDQ